MRLRLRRGLQNWLRRRSIKALLMLGLAGAALLLLIGGGVYAALGGFAQTPTSNDINLQKGLVGWWKLDGNTKDSTPYAHNATATGATLTTNRKGVANSAYALSGSGQYITIPHNTTVKPTTAITLSTWIKPTNLAIDLQRIISTTESGGYGLLVTTTTSGSGCTTNSVCVSMFVAGAYRGISMPSSLLTTGTWNYVTGTYDGTTFRIYLNGVQQATASFSGSITESASAPICIGSEPATTCSNGGGGYFNGSVSDVRIYNRAVSGPEVSALYSQYNAQVNSASGENGLVAWWKLDGNGKDSTPYADDGALTGAANITDRKGASNAAISFNGTAGSDMIVPNSPRLQLTGNMTISAWVNLTNNSNYAPIVSKGAGVGEYEIAADFRSGGTTLAWRSTSSGTSTNFAGYFSGYTGQWVHVVVTVSGTTATAYRNGQLIGSIAIGTRTTGTGAVYLGNRSAGALYLSGSIDDVRVYNRALSAQDVTTISNSYNSQINLNSSPTNSQTVNLNSGLLAYWPFNGNAKDNTPYSDDGTVTGATLTTDRNSRANSAYNFGGSGYINAPLTALPAAMTTATINFWAKPTLATGGATIAATPDTSTNRIMMLIYYTNGNSYCDFGNIGVNGRIFVANNVGWLNTWAMWTCTIKPGTGMAMYRNGVLLTSSATTSTFTKGTKTLDIGRLAATYWQGSVDDVRIYNRALSTTEITALYGNYY